MAKCNKCNLPIYDQDAAEFEAANHKIDCEEFSSGPEYCECEEKYLRALYPNGLPPNIWD